MPWVWITLVLLLTVAVALALSWRARPRGASLEEARRLFRQQREHLEADFLRAAAASGKPRGLRWKSCDWEPDVVYARERQTGRLHALVGVTISFEAVEGSDMEGIAAVGNLRNASGVFFFERGRWRTGGRTVFNLNPAEAIEHFKQQYERIVTG